MNIELTPEQVLALYRNLNESKKADYDSTFYDVEQLTSVYDVVHEQLIEALELRDLATADVIEEDESLESLPVDVEDLDYDHVTQQFRKWFKTQKNAVGSLERQNEDLLPKSALIDYMDRAKRQRQVPSPVVKVFPRRRSMKGYLDRTGTSWFRYVEWVKRCRRWCVRIQLKILTTLNANDNGIAPFALAALRNGWGQPRNRKFQTMVSRSRVDVLEGGARNRVRLVFTFLTNNTKRHRRVTVEKRTPSL